MTVLRGGRLTFAHPARRTQQGRGAKISRPHTAIVASVANTNEVDPLASLSNVLARPDSTPADQADPLFARRTGQHRDFDQAGRSQDGYVLPPTRQALSPAERGCRRLYVEPSRRA